MTSAAPELTIALPIKDGEARLLETLREVDDFVRRCGRRCEVVAVDDGSADATPQLLADFAAEHAYMRVLRHERNLGKGAALKTAAREARGELLLCMDADATYALEPLEDFLAALEAGCDAAIGNRRDRRTRFVLHPTAFPYVGWRHALGWLYVRTARVLLGLRVSDTQCGFKCYRTATAKRRFHEVEADGFDFDVELLALLEFHGHEIAELPVVYVYRDQMSTLRLFRDGVGLLRRLLQVRNKLRRLRRSGRFADAGRADYQHLAQREGHPVQRFWHAQKWPLVEALLGIGAGHRVLDVGTGSSEVSLRAAERARLSCASDASLAPLRFLRREACAVPRGASLCCAGADVRALPFRDGSFERVVALEVIEHLPAADIARLLAELRRVLAPGGRLLVTTPNSRSAWPAIEWLVDRRGGAARMGGEQHLSHFHARRLREVIEAADLSVLRVGSVYHLSPFVSPFAPALAERLFDWEWRYGGRAGPILYAVAEAGAARAVAVPPFGLAAGGA